MRRDATDTRPIDAAAAGGTAYPILQHKDDEDIVAIRARQPINRATFLRDVNALAARLPDHEYILNLCTDRYRFMVGFAAALCRQQISLLPPGDTAGILRVVAEDYPDLYALTDTTQVPLPSLIYPEILDGGDAKGAVHLVPGQQPALILFTSGSTGRPTPVAKTWGTLVRSARAAGERLGVQRRAAPTVIGTVPHQHSYGLESTILLGLQHGLIIDAGGLFYPADIRARVEAANSRCVLVTTPVHLQALVAEPDGRSMFPRSAHRDLRLHRGGTDGDAPIRSGRALAMPERRYDRCKQRRHVGKRRRGRGSGFAAGRRRADCRRAVLSSRPIRRSGGCSGKTDVSGSSQPPLDEDGAFVMQDQDGGPVARLGALVVAPGLGADAIRGALRERIDPAFLPRPLVVVDNLPRNALGKLPRDKLLKLLRGGKES
jgi:acyl-CoA synthetase (AMP-forming)/AMP-acid ligase II